MKKNNEKQPTPVVGNNPYGKCQLKVDKTIGQRCFTKEWVINRLGSENANRADLIDALEAGKVDLFVTLEKGGADGAGQVWKINPNIYQDTRKLPSKVNGEATLVFGEP